MVGAFELFKASAGLDVSDGIDGFGINTGHGPGDPSMMPRTFRLVNGIMAKRMRGKPKVLKGIFSCVR